MAENRHSDDEQWQQRFRAPVVLGTQLARDNAERGLAVSNRSGVYQLYAWDVPTGTLRQLTNTPEGKLGGFITADGRQIYYHEDVGGNEIGHFVRVSFEGGEPEDVTPDLPPYSPAGVAVSRDTNLFGFTLAGDDGFGLYVVDLPAPNQIGEPRPIYKSRSLAFGPSLSYGGELAAMTSTERTGMQHYSVLVFDTRSGERLGELWDGPESSVRAWGFARRQGDTRLLATTNRTGVRRPLVWNPVDGTRVDLDLEELPGEVEVYDWSDDGARILLCQFDRAVQRLFLYDLGSRTLSPLAHPPGTYGGAYFAPSGEIWAQWQDSTHPPQLVALDGGTGALLRTVLIGGDVPEGRPWRSVSFRSSDGQEIQAWLATPAGNGPFPTILDTHGGPETVQTESFSARSQAWLDHGYAFMTINYRGSTTFGRAFQEQIWGNLGHWEIEDMVAARDYLVREGIAQPDQILLTGWSYGGYLTLMGLGRRPDLWAGGMAGIAIADWRVQYEDSAEMLKGYQAAIFGGTPEEKPEEYARSSPITYVEHVAAPVLIIQGRNDTRTPARPIELYEARLRELGKPVEVEWFDAGHLGSFAQVELSIGHQEHMLRFAERLLGRS